MKNLGWHLFFSLLVTDALALVMLHLSVNLNTVLVVCGIVFVILAIVLIASGIGRQRIRKREQKATAKIAELQNKVPEVASPEERAVQHGDEPTVADS